MLSSRSRADLRQLHHHLPTSRDVSLSSTHRILTLTLTEAMSDVLTLTVSRRGGAGGKPIEIQLPSSASTKDLFSIVAAKTKVAQSGHGAVTCQ